MKTVELNLSITDPKNVFPHIALFEYDKGTDKERYFKYLVTKRNYDGLSAICIDATDQEKIGNCLDNLTDQYTCIPVEKPFSIVFN
jgi:hypothetical protein